jgi:methyl-accepting chemotaxis protein
MAAATTQLSSSANEIARRSVEASGIVGRAVAETNNASSKVEELVGAAGKIGDVTKIINDIAGQTHLLALNATIEAARAGEYGKGFAVVAAEVKALAQQTERATKEIAQQVEGIQISSNAIAGTIKLVSDVISTMNEISLSISSAVEEQSSATSEAAKNIQGVKGAAEDNVRLSTNVLGVAQELAANAEHLQERVDEFLRNVRTM